MARSEALAAAVPGWRIPLNADRLGGHARPSMNEADVLLAMAEVAVALLGFAAIVSVFRQRGTWRPDGRFWAMIAAGIGTLVFSLLPLPLLFGGITQASTWQTCDALLGAYALGYCAFLTRSFRRDRATDSAPNVSIFALLLSGSALNGALLVLSAFGYLGDPQFWPYLVGLIWFQIVTAVFFVRLLVVWLR